MNKPLTFTESGYDMQFIQNVQHDRYEAFVRNHPSKSHFLQSAAWGEFNAEERGMTPHLVGLEDEKTGELRAAALLLERKPTLFPCYMYAPRGYVLDFTDHALLREMTEKVREFAKSRGAMFIAIDPDVERRAIQADGSPVPGGFDNQPIIDDLLSLGYRHRGFNLGFEGREPRFTFRIDLTPDEKAIGKAFTGNVLKNIKKSHHYAVNVREGGYEDVEKLYEMITLTSKRDEFYAYPLHYYQNFYRCLAKEDMAHLYIGTVDPAKTVDLLKEELADTLAKREKLKKEGPLQESRETEGRLLREIPLFEEYARNYPGEVTVSAHLVVRYGNKSWAVHAGSSGIMNETFCNNRTYYEKMMAQKAAGCIFLDQFGTVGRADADPDFGSVHAFKRQWGGRYIEFIGEFDLVTKPFWFWLYETVRPAYRRFRIKLKEIVRSVRG